MKRPFSYRVADNTLTIEKNVGRLYYVCFIFNIIFTLNSEHFKNIYLPYITVDFE